MTEGHMVKEMVESPRHAELLFCKLQDHKPDGSVYQLCRSLTPLFNAEDDVASMSAITIIPRLWHFSPTVVLKQSRLAARTTEVRQLPGAVVALREGVCDTPPAARLLSTYFSPHLRRRDSRVAVIPSPYPHLHTYTAPLFL